MTAASRRHLLLVAALAGLVIAVTLLPVASWLIATVEWVRSAGALGVVAFSVIYIAAAVLLLPASVLTLGAGFVYGPIWGTLLVSPVSVAAAVVAFAAARTALRGWVTRRFARGPRFAALDRAIADDGFKIVALLRLSPVFPYNMLNYLCGVTRIDAKRYALASWLGMLPGTLLYVYLGSVATNAAELAAGGSGPASPWQRAFYWLGLAATLAVTIAITRLARRALRKSLADTAPSGTAAAPTTAADRGSSS